MHIREKVTDTTKYNHPALLFVRTSINRFISLLCMYSQARKSPVMNRHSCILEHPSRGGFLPAVDRDLDCSYLHYSDEDYDWIRSRKAVDSDASSPRNGIVFRNETGHIKKAATASLVEGECFYTLYPSQLNVNQLPNRLGYFEDLTQYCGFCFNRSKYIEPLISTVPGKSLLDWTLYIDQLKRANVNGCNTLREKQLIIVSYFFEMCYDICLSPRHNVSKNPGFESILGIFDNRKTV